MLRFQCCMGGDHRGDMCCTAHHAAHLCTCCRPLAVQLFWGNKELTPAYDAKTLLDLNLHTGFSVSVSRRLPNEQAEQARLRSMPVACPSLPSLAPKPQERCMRAQPMPYLWLPLSLHPMALRQHPTSPRRAMTFQWTPTSGRLWWTRLRGGAS